MKFMNGLNEVICACSFALLLEETQPSPQGVTWMFTHLFIPQIFPRVPTLYYVPSSIADILDKIENKVSGSESLLLRQGKYEIFKMNIKHVK